MQADTIRRAVLEAIGTIAPETDFARLRHDLPLRDQVELDSIDWMNVLETLRERVGVDVAASELDRLASVDDVVARVAQPGARPRPRELAAAAAKLLAPRECRVGDALVTVRPLCRDDLEREASFVRALSPESRYERFMTAVRELPQAKLEHLTDVDQRGHVALAATVERDGAEAIVGVVRYIVDATGDGCEFAIALDDGWHGSGLAGTLMHDLIAIARARGLARMEGLVLTTNAAMLKFSRQLGFRLQHDPGDRDTLRVVRELRAPA